MKGLLSIRKKVKSLLSLKNIFRYNQGFKEITKLGDDTIMPLFQLKFIVLKYCIPLII